MVVEDSQCICGNCGNKMIIQWEVEFTNSYERQMGAELEYIGDSEEVCSECGNEIFASIQINEYPVGTLEVCQVTRVKDSCGTSSIVETPVVYFYDL